MKLELKPGVSPAFFWTTISVGVASTAASALALTSYAWAGMAGALIALIVGFVRGQVKPPPGAQIILFFALCSSLFALSSCSSFTKQDAINYGERVGLFAGDAAIVLAQLQLANAQSELEMELSNPAADKRAIMIKQLGVSTAQQALKAASAAITNQRAKLDAKQPRENVQPTAMRDKDVPECLKASSTNHLSGLCFGNSADCQSTPNALPMQAGHSVLMRNGGAAPLSFSNATADAERGRFLERDLSLGFNSRRGDMPLTPRIAIPDHGRRVAFMLATGPVR